MQNQFRLLHRQRRIPRVPGLCRPGLLRALDDKETRQEDVRAHRRQALLAMTSGAGAWVLVLVAFLLLFLTRNSLWPITNGLKANGKLSDLHNLVFQLGGDVRIIPAVQTQPAP